MFETMNVCKNWLAIRNKEGNVERVIDIAQIRTLKKYECEVYEGEGLKAKSIKKEKTIIEYLNGDEIILDLPISSFLKPLGLDNC